MPHLLIKLPDEVATLLQQHIEKGMTCTISSPLHGIEVSYNPPIGFSGSFCPSVCQLVGSEIEVVHPCQPTRFVREEREIDFEEEVFTPREIADRDELAAIEACAQLESQREYEGIELDKEEEMMAEILSEFTPTISNILQFEAAPTNQRKERAAMRKQFLLGILKRMEGVSMTHAELADLATQSGSENFSTSSATKYIQELLSEGKITLLYLPQGGKTYKVREVDQASLGF